MAAEAVDLRGLARCSREAFAELEYLEDRVRILLVETQRSERPERALTDEDDDLRGDRRGHAEPDELAGATRQRRIDLGEHDGVDEEQQQIHRPQDEDA